KAPDVPMSTEPLSPEDVNFNALMKQWLDGSLRLSPVNATQIGDHRFDTELDDVSDKGRKARADFRNGVISQLTAIDKSKLSKASQVDAAMVSNQLNYDKWDDEVCQSWAWDPQGYNELAGDAIYLLVAREFAPLPDRLRNATARMEKLPTLLAQT